MTLADGWPPFYSERKSSADVDAGQLYVAFVAAALVSAFVLVLPGFHGLERSFFLARWTLSLLVGTLIVACGLGISWQVGQVTADLRYKVTDENLTTFDVGLKIGLVQFNVTLEGGSQEKLNMNEKFFYNTIDEMMEKALLRGMPFPILSVAEHFSSTSFHSLWPWGRAYWLAGHYSSYLLWTALASWVITNVLFHMTRAYGSLFMTLTGVLLVAANISFSTVNSTGKFAVTMGHNDPPKILRVLYGWCFWVCLVTGLFCVTLGFSLYVLENTKKGCLETFFMVPVEEERLDSPASSKVFFGNVTEQRNSSLHDPQSGERENQPISNHKKIIRISTQGEDQMLETIIDGPVSFEDERRKSPLKKSTFVKE